MTIDEFEKMMDNYRGHLNSNDKSVSGYYYICRTIVQRNIKFIDNEADRAFLALKYSEFLNDC